jgi:cation diffusion facilitator CzcD-associated flavoprotein CzcO
MMTYTAKRVAVIGAGVSGVTSAKYLKAAGVEVVVYERSSKSGGNWFVQVSSSLLGFTDGNGPGRTMSVSPQMQNTLLFCHRRPN